MTQTLKLSPLLQFFQLLVKEVSEVVGQIPLQSPDSSEGGISVELATEMLAGGHSLVLTTCEQGPAVLERQIGFTFTRALWVPEEEACFDFMVHAHQVSEPGSSMVNTGTAETMLQLNTPQACSQAAKVLAQFAVYFLSTGDTENVASRTTDLL